MPKYCLIICLWLLWGGCKEKEEPEEQTGTPVFGVTGDFDGSSIKLTGGVNKYYMATDFLTDPYSIYVFGGELKKDNCTACGPSLKISVRNYTLNFPFTIDSSDIAGNYSYYNTLSALDTFYTVEYTAIPFGLGNASVTWDFGNAIFYAGEKTTIRYEDHGIYNISGTASFASNNCSSTLSQPVFLTPTRVGKHIDFNINYIDTLNLMFNSIPIDENAAVSWNFGDGNTSTGTIVTHQYTTTGLYKVCMMYIKGSDTMQYCKQVNTLDYTGCKSNYTFKSALFVDSLNLSKVIIDWKDEAGIKYSSANIKQPSTSSFKILSATNYGLNEKGQRTRQLEVQFSCIVSNGTTTHELKNMQGTIAVAYP
jgi:PKD repeat protein